MAADTPDITGLKRMDAALLVALAMRAEGRPPARGLRRVALLLRLYAMARFQVGRRVRRLERRGYVEPGSSIWKGRLPVVTPEGVRAARLAGTMLELEDSS